MIVPVTCVGALDFDHLAADLFKQLAQRRIAGQVDGEGLQRLGDRVTGAVGDGRDPAAAEVLQHHALEQVVDVLDAEAEIDRGIPFHRAAMLEVADPGTEQDHPLDRDDGRRRVGLLPPNGAFLGDGESRCKNQSTENPETQVSV